MVSPLDPALLEALLQFESRRFEGEAWRVTWEARNPLAGSSAGGRWSPAGRFDALYMSLDRNGALAEAYHHLSSAPVMSSSHMLLNKLLVSLDHVLELGIDQLAALGMEDSMASRPRSILGQSIGEAAFVLDFEGLIVPSARWDCSNLVVFLNPASVDAGGRLTFVEAMDVNWPAWREQARGD